MSGRTPYMADIWKAGVEVGRPTLIGVSRQPRCRTSRARKGAVPSVSACVSTERERPSIWTIRDRKSTRLNSSHGYISYAVFCLKKKKKKKQSNKAPDRQRWQ